MELLVASAIGLMTAAAVYLILQRRTFPIVVGLTLLSYAVNIFLFSAGRLIANKPPIISDADAYTDPLPQALDGLIGPTAVMFRRLRPANIEILTDLDTAPGRAIMVGDTEYDMQMAANAGVPAVGLTHGVHSAERLLTHGAMQCFDDLFSLAHWLREH